MVSEGGGSAASSLRGQYHSSEGHGVHHPQSISIDVVMRVQPTASSCFYTALPCQLSGSNSALVGLAARAEGGMLEGSPPRPAQGCHDT